ncbi:3-deoxy-D-manno-octulosonic acid transferase [Alphaproteobacteria bacterium GH1-50]|uniref:3-deoxy-D-manno-octulosonic acid transferase n=1 Tax=Kangsaoukella pontilimi TaxID=2691042 RepID=A0A7C9IE46_9RHOB|nr:glycosyltransferase N-terminal domain-containing protein [Kangsaoukella pontilimi]MXQ06464.1 3-deoxy-D-manno-octulosonic acid transferase [Kangsaoukella pontilimi]
MQKGKELPERVGEKYGEYTTPRPEGEVLWFHALSVGESLALIPLIEKALAAVPGLSVVLTTSTATSVAALDRAGLPDRAHHVLLPMDTAQAVRRFLDHWRPSVAVFAELDFWPRLMTDTHRRGIPMILVNSRMSERNVESRSRMAGMTRDILSLFDALLLQDDASVPRFRALGAPPERISVVGALKAAARPLPADEVELAELRAAIGTRPVWLAAATERSEHPSIVAAAQEIARNHGEALAILAPRHVADGPPLAEAIAATGLAVARRGAGDAIFPDTQVYVADTIGEMGLWYRLAPISFVGHSLPPAGVALGGKNPYEAAALGSVMLHGPGLGDFEESYAALQEAGASLLVESAGGLAAEVMRLFAPEVRAPYLAAAERVVEERRAVLDRTWQVIDAAR